jgi:hypothetical protein
MSLHASLIQTVALRASGILAVRATTYHRRISSTSDYPSSRASGGRTSCAFWSPARAGAAGESSLADCQVDCQPLELAMFGLDGGERMQAADLVIWTATDWPEHAGKS